ncbi:Cation/H(+) antiporter 4 [Linum perenne]
MLASLVVKFTICLVLTLPWMPRSDSSVLALIMSSKGIYDLGVYTIHRDSMVIYPALFPSATYLYSVCMIYMGGSDDHEALCLAARMAKDSNLHLTVLHLNYRQDEDASTNRRNRLSTNERLFDEIVLKEALKEISEFPNVQYIERPVEDGPQTALAIRTIVNERRNGLESPQTSGLGEWSEFPELGIIGDLLASQDLETKASVLVVQQQKQFKK